MTDNIGNLVKAQTSLPPVKAHIDQIYENKDKIAILIKEVGTLIENMGIVMGNQNLLAKALCIKQDDNGKWLEKVKKDEKGNDIGTELDLSLIDDFYKFVENVNVQNAQDCAENKVDIGNLYNAVIPLANKVKTIDNTVNSYLEGEMVTNIWENGIPKRELKELKDSCNALMEICTYAVNGFEHLYYKSKSDENTKEVELVQKINNLITSKIQSFEGINSEKEIKKVKEMLESRISSYIQKEFHSIINKYFTNETSNAFIEGLKANGNVSIPTVAEALLMCKKNVYSEMIRDKRHNPIEYKTKYEDIVKVFSSKRYYNKLFENIKIQVDRITDALDLAEKDISRKVIKEMKDEEKRKQKLKIHNISEEDWYKYHEVAVNIQNANEFSKKTEYTEIMSEPGFKEFINNEWVQEHLKARSIYNKDKELTTLDESGNEELVSTYVADKENPNKIDSIDNESISDTNTSDHFVIEVEASAIKE